MINRFEAGPRESVITRHRIKLNKIKQNFPSNRQSNSIKTFSNGRVWCSRPLSASEHWSLFSGVCVFVSSMSEMISTTKSNGHGSRWFRLADLETFLWYTFHRDDSEYGNKVEPVYKGHPRDLRNWPLIFFSLIYTNVTIPYFFIHILNGSQVYTSIKTRAFSNPYYLNDVNALAALWLVQSTLYQWVSLFHCSPRKKTIEYCSVIGYWPNEPLLLLVCTLFLSNTVGFLYERPAPPWGICSFSKIK